MLPREVVVAQWVRILVVADLTLEADLVVINVIEPVVVVEVIVIYLIGITSIVSIVGSVRIVKPFGVFLWFALGVAVVVVRSSSSRLRLSVFGLWLLCGVLRGVLLCCGLFGLRLGILTLRRLRAA